jgi:DNA polymerase III sliding clamp (beta) subunit (PCNA family)
MKFKTKSTPLKRAAASLKAISAFSKNKDDQENPCLITATADGLILESANFGVYVKHVLEAEVEKEGEFGVSASVLEKGITGTDLTVERVTGRKPEDCGLLLRSSRTKHLIGEFKKAQNTVHVGRPRTKKNRFTAKIPVEFLAELARTVAFKPGLKEESLRVQLAIENGQAEMNGMDSYSFARVRFVHNKIKARGKLQTIMKTSLINNILRELDQEEIVKIGLINNAAGKPAQIHFSGSTFDIYYPVLNMKYIDLDTYIKNYLKRGKISCSFIADKKELQEAVGHATALKAGAEDVILKIAVSKKNTIISAHSGGGKSNTKVPTKERKIQGKKQDVFVHQGYFSSFLHLAPEVVPLKVESWGKAYLRVIATNMESDLIEFLVSRANPSVQS